MAAVLLADELMDLREAHEAMLQAAAEVLRDASQDGQKPDAGKSPARDQASKSDSAKPDAASKSGPTAGASATASARAKG